MPNHISDRWHGKYMWWMFSFMLVLSSALFFFKWYIGLIAWVGSGALLVFARKAEQAFGRQFL